MYVETGPVFKLTPATAIFPIFVDATIFRPVAGLILLEVAVVTAVWIIEVGDSPRSGFHFVDFAHSFAAREVQLF